MAPVILQTEVHCSTCAWKIRKAIWNLLGVERVWASPETGLVVVAGTADAWVLKRRIQRKIRRRVTIVSDGTVPPAAWGTSQYYAGMPPPPAYSPYGWGTAPPPPHPHPYYFQQPASYYDPYAGNYWPPASDLHYDHVPSAAPTCSIL